MKLLNLHFGVGWEKTDLWITKMRSESVLTVKKTIFWFFCLPPETLQHTWPTETECKKKTLYMGFESSYRN